MRRARQLPRHILAHPHDAYGTTRQRSSCAQSRRRRRTTRAIRSSRDGKGQPGWRGPRALDQFTYQGDNDLLSRLDNARRDHAATRTTTTTPTTLTRGRLFDDAATNNPRPLLYRVGMLDLSDDLSSARRVRLRRRHRCGANASRGRDHGLHLTRQDSALARPLHLTAAALDWPPTADPTATAMINAEHPDTDCERAVRKPGEDITRTPRRRPGPTYGAYTYTLPATESARRPGERRTAKGTSTLPTNT